MRQPYIKNEPQEKQEMQSAIRMILLVASISILFALTGRLLPHSFDEELLPSAESAKENSPGRRPQSGRAPGYNRELESPVRAKQVFCSALTGLGAAPIRYPGFQSPLRVLFHPGLFCFALSALY